MRVGTGPDRLMCGVMGRADGVSSCRASPPMLCRTSGVPSGLPVRNGHRTRRVAAQARGHDATGQERLGRGAWGKGGVNAGELGIQVLNPAMVDAAICPRKARGAGKADDARPHVAVRHALQVDPPAVARRADQDPARPVDAAAGEGRRQMGRIADHRHADLRAGGRNPRDRVSRVIGADGQGKERQDNPQPEPCGILPVGRAPVQRIWLSPGATGR